MIQGLSIIIPALNESLGLGTAVAKVVSGIPPSIRTFEVIVVDDGSTDDTARVVDALSRQYPFLQAVRHPINQGKGAALASGFARARMEWVLFLDADSQISPAELTAFETYAGPFDLVIGYRIQREDSFLRRFLSRGFGFLTAACLGLRVRDVNCPFKLFRRSLLDDITLISRGFLIDAELLSKALSRGYRIKEIAVPCAPRQQGSSSVRFRHFFETLRELIQVSLHK